MKYIKYSTNNGWKENDAISYGKYFSEKLSVLQNAYALDSYKESEKICKTINNANVNLNLSEVAEGANKIIESSGFIEQAQALTQEVINNINKTGQDFIKYSNSADIALQIQNNLAEGITFEIDSKNIPSLEGSILSSFQDKNSLSNNLGILGESMSRVTGAAIAQSVKAEIEKQLPKGSKIAQTQATYTNVGGDYHGKYRSQTDNNLNINFKIDTNGRIGELNLNLNVSDKLNSRFAKVKKSKTTGRINLRNSTVAAQMEQGDEEATYNLISYHKIKGNKITYMTQKPGQELRTYYGYKLLVDMLIKAEEYKDKVNFTVYGGRAIPESNIIEKMLTKTKTDKYRYQAEIRYYTLLKDNIKNEEQAQEIIDKLPVQIGNSFSFDI